MLARREPRRILLTSNTWHALALAVIARCAFDSVSALGLWSVDRGRVTHTQMYTRERHMTA